MEINLRRCACFGVAGNFTGHLEQAGEAADFTKVKTAESNAPKALFPTYLPHRGEHIPAFLNVFPFDEYRIIFPAGSQNLQIEPELAIICDAIWSDGKVVDLKPLVFGASNDCSIRREGARKISEKKNWGESTKGLAGNLIKIDSFAPGGILDGYRIASFLVREGQVYEYGEDSAVRDYSYFYQKLLTWLVDKLNHQADEGPAENVNLYLNEAHCPQQLMISVGATRYTEFGKTHYLQNGDTSVVVIYPEAHYSREEILKRVERDNLEEDDISVLMQQYVQ
ncbi:MAG: hypothetical protein IAB19_02630 [Proteobacteria bacterium]|uniref:Uncharacterized protein n=1 Tax=Candidatus Avisuccinivibrio stercorigallinarum TaxID=2840704 RepID=A0A9D9DBD8_9GAMM|nr:hypothetical protein [Candidatus Avisuccinivibrio stercorigallinarum]